MLAQGTLLRAIGGRLVPNDASAEQGLLETFSMAESGDEALGTRGVAVPLVAVASNAIEDGEIAHEIFELAVLGTAHVRVTVPVNPLTALTVIVEVPGEPTTALTVVGLDVTVKLGAAVTV